MDTQVSELDGRREGSVLHWTDVCYPLEAVLQHPRSCRLSGGCGAETFLLRKQCGCVFGTTFWSQSSFFQMKKSLGV